jgi:hypothetical protein
MKTSVILAATLLLASDLHAQAKPNFAGTWTLDATPAGGGGRGDRTGNASGGGGRRRAR